MVNIDVLFWFLSKFLSSDSSLFEMKQIACMSLDLKKSEKIMVGLGFDLGISQTWCKHATNEPMLHHATESKYRRYTIRIWQDSFILSCKPVHMILNKKYNATQFSKKK